MSAEAEKFDSLVRAWKLPTALLASIASGLSEAPAIVDIELKHEDLPGDALEVARRLASGEEISDREFLSASVAIEVAKRKFEELKAAEVFRTLSFRPEPPVVMEPDTSTALTAPASAITAPFETPRDLHGPAAGNISGTPDLDNLKRETMSEFISLRQENQAQQVQMAAMKEEVTSIKGAMHEILALLQAKAAQPEPKPAKPERPDAKPEPASSLPPSSPEAAEDSDVDDDETVFDTIEPATAQRALSRRLGSSSRRQFCSRSGRARPGQEYRRRDHQAVTGRPRRVKPPPTTNRPASPRTNSSNS